MASPIRSIVIKLKTSIQFRFPGLGWKSLVSHGRLTRSISPAAVCPILFCLIALNHSTHLTPSFVNLADGYGFSRLGGFILDPAEAIMRK